MSFSFYKTDNTLHFIDHGGYESRNTSTIWCIKEADKIYKWKDFDIIKIYTGDTEDECDGITNTYTYSNKTSTYKTIPDFNFHAWPEVGILDYNTFTHDIHLAGLEPTTYNKVGWIGNIDTNFIRKKAYEISLDNKDIMDITPMNWSGRTPQSESLQLNSTKYLSTPDLVKRYSILIDIEGNGYSGRVKHLLWSHRPLIIVDRPHKEFFYDYLVPWTHYIPVKRDLSDLLHNIEWCFSNKTKARKIAENAYYFSQTHLTRDVAYKRWDEIISNR